MALAQPNCFDGERGVLIITSIDLWERWNSVIGSSCSNNGFKIFSELEKADILVAGSVKFDCLLLVKAKHIADLPLEQWFKLVDENTFGLVNLKKYLSNSEAKTPTGQDDYSKSLADSATKKVPVDTLQLDSLVPADTLQLESLTNKSSTDTLQLDPTNQEDTVGLQFEKENLDPSAKTASRFKMSNVGKSVSTFIDENTAKNTKRTNITVINLFNEFVSEIHPELKGADTIEAIEVVDFPKLLSEFFMVIAKEDGEDYNASTLETYYQGLTRVILEKRKINIKLEPAFSEVRKVLGRRQKESCEKGEIPGKHKAKSIPASVLAECWAQGAFGTESPRALVTTVLLHTQSSFGTRGKTELWNITNGDIISGPERYKLV